MAKQLSQTEKQVRPRRTLEAKPEPESVIPNTNDMTRPLKTVVYEDMDKTYVQEPIDFITQKDLDAYAAEYEDLSGNPYEEYYDDSFVDDDEPDVDSVMTESKNLSFEDSSHLSDLDEPDGIVVDDGIGDMSGLSTHSSESISSDYLAPHSSGVIELPEVEPVSSRKKWFIAAGATACALALAVGGFILFGGNGSPEVPESTGVVATQQVTEEPPTSRESVLPPTNDDDEEEKESQEYSVAQLPDVIQNLEFDGSSVSVPEDVEITAKDGHVLVTQKGEIQDGKYGETLQSVAEGAAAFATELDGDTIDGTEAKRVTWVVKDTEDADKFAITNSTGSAPKQGNFRTVLAASGGYLMDQDWFNKVKEELGLPNLVAKQGITPTNLEGDAFDIAVPEGASDDSGDDAAAEDAEEKPDDNAGGSATEERTQSTQQQQQQTQQQQSQTQQPFQSQQSQGSSSSGSTTTRPSSPSQGSTSSGTVTTPSGGYGAQTGSGERTWVPEKGHYEPITEQVWVDTTTTHKVYHYKCGCGQIFDTAEQCQAHQVAARRVDPRHSLVTTTTSETVEDPGGHWEEREVGQQWVVDEPGHWE